ncbi:discoidin domain-containing protein [uncultured Muribaculum sp.]|uniref:endo-beta-N-acetylglucosaminidase n=1 Tax=uncultured Muribaculum sp. TaxID=1918613 RepID=UPI002600AEA3|nr:discoidin domain-containing protein [uncultured Muribaculum sp.]
MSFKNLLTSAIIASSIIGYGGGTADAQQPYAGCWFPDDVRDWTPEYDKDAKFNRSRIPLKKRLRTPEPMKANAEQFEEGQLMLEAVSAKMCGQCSAQGFDNFIGYLPTYWQYYEKLVNWGGADDEGIIVFPPAGTVDAAHTQGTKVYATIFFQATTNGKPWAKQIVTEEDGKFPYAEQLYKMAKYYNIDGYFINDESHQGLQSTWISWVKYFYEVAEADGDMNMEIVWYDASNYPAVNMLKTNPRSSHFIDYGGGAGDYRGYADQIGSTVEETFHRIYGGIECARAGLTSFGSSLNTAYPRTGHVGSLALFCPEEHTWKDNVNKLFFTENARGEQAYEAMRKTFESERRTYVNNDGDPSKITSGEGSMWSAPWRGFAGCLVESTSIDVFPFITSFNVGNGKHRFVEGVIEGTRDYSHAGMQSYLPTWRWWIENGDNLKESIDWDDAYSGGNSMLISGSLSAGSHLMRLYKMVAPCDGGKLRLVYKSNNAVTPVLRLSTQSTVDPDMEINASSTSQTNGWTVAEYDLTPANGKTIYMVAFDLKADADIAAYEMRLGQMVIIPAGYSPKAVDITNLTIQNKLGEEGGDIRVTWDWADNSDLDHFDIYTIDAAGKRTLAGQTRGEGYYIPEVKRAGTESGINVEVVPVMKDASKGIAKTVIAEYPKATAPVVKIRTSCSYAKVGQEITLTATGTFLPSACKWILPEGMAFAEGCDGTEFTTRVHADALGSYTVKAQLTNEVGTGEAEAFVFEVLSDGDYADIRNVALNKSIHSQSAAASYLQTASNLVDGDRKPYNIDKKWCSTGKNPYAVINLGDVYVLYGFAFFDCNSGRETYNNIEKYQIQTSLDAKTWTTVVDETGRGADDVKYDYIYPVKARYVKLAPYGDNNITTRVWEFETYGREAISLSLEAPQEISVVAGEPQTVTVAYDLKGESRDNLQCTVTPGGNLIVGEVIEDADKATFSFDVTGERILGASQLTVRVENGGVVREHVITVNIDVTDAENVLSGLPVEIRRYLGNYTPEAAYDKVDVQTLTDGDTKKDGLLEAVETASRYEYDIWAVVDAGKTLNLSKIKVHIPDDNFGTSEIEATGYVNKDISLKVSGDGKSWTDLKTFSNLKNVSELTYILPSFREVRYIAVACNLNTFFYASLAEIEAYEQLAEMIPVTRPVSIKNGFNGDFIAETTDIAGSTTDKLDGEGWVLYTSDVKEQGAVAGTDGKVTSREGIPYQLGDYDKPNAMKLMDYESGTLEFAQPVSAEKLYLLLICADGGGSVKAVINYEDGSKEEAQTFNTIDWYSSYDNGYAKYGLSRVNREGLDFDTRYKFLLSETVLNANISKKAVSIDLTNQRSCKPTFLAVSMTGRNSTSGIADNIADKTAEAEIEAIYNLQGVRVANPGKGIHIVRYTDGTTKKVYIR